VELIAELPGGKQFAAREQRAVAGVAVERLSPGDSVIVDWPAAASMLLEGSPPAPESAA
jgi:hypothetical protein